MGDTYKINARALRAASIFASRDAARYIMNGVLLREIVGEQAYFVATDGRRIVTVLAGFVSDKTLDAIIPIHLVERVGWAAAIKPDSEFSITIADRKISLSWSLCARNGASFGSTTITGKAVEGRYPNFLQVIPKLEDAPCPCVPLSADYVMDFCKAQQILNPARGKSRKTAIVFRNAGKSDQPVVVYFPDDEAKFFGVLMPLRIEDGSNTITGRPGYVRAPEKKSDVE